MNRCFHCGNKLIPANTDIHVSYEELIVEIQDAPCNRCSFCNRIFYGDDVFQTVERFVDTIKPKGVSGTVVNYYENILQGIDEA